MRLAKLPQKLSESYQKIAWDVRRLAISSDGLSGKKNIAVLLCQGISQALHEGGGSSSNTYALINADLFCMEALPLLDDLPAVDVKPDFDDLNKLLSVLTPREKDVMILQASDCGAHYVPVVIKAGL